MRRYRDRSNIAPAPGCLRHWVLRLDNDGLAANLKSPRFRVGSLTCHAMLLSTPLLPMYASGDIQICLQEPHVLVLVKRCYSSICHIKQAEKQIYVTIGQRVSFTLFFERIIKGYPQVIHYYVKNWWITPFSRSIKKCYNPGGEMWGVVVNLLPKWRILACGGG